ncbi:MAG: Fic family protein [Candidatus Eremiobacterota bacterium]
MKIRESGHYVTTIDGYKAFIPEPLPPNPGLKVDKELEDLVFQAHLSLSKLDGLGCFITPELQEKIINTYIKKEALLSSQIEGTRATMEDVFAYKQIPLAKSGEVEQVFNYIEALNYGREMLEKLPICLRLIKEMHAVLLKGGKGMPGSIRNKQVIIGDLPRHVPPPPDKLNELLKEFEDYLNEESNDYSPLIKCSLLHYQFEAIHPFIDGNGRIGRVLITLYLIWKGIIKTPLLYLSYYFKKNLQEYYDRLKWVSDKGNFEQWVTFFLNGILVTVNAVIKTSKDIVSLQDKNRKILLTGKKVSTTMLLLIEDLILDPVISIRDVQAKYNVTNKTASNIIYQLIDLGILEERDIKRQRDKSFKYSEYIKIIKEGTEQ